MVIDKDGRLLHSFGLDGEKEGWYGACCGIAFTPDGHICGE